VSLYQAVISISIVIDAATEEQAEELLEEMIAEDHEIDDLYEINESQVAE
jgi:hypothetical protein